MRVNLFQNRGSVAVIAKGIRNAIGLWFDSPDRLLFTSFGSDRAAVADEQRQCVCGLCVRDESMPRTRCSLFTDGGAAVVVREQK